MSNALVLIGVLHGLALEVRSNGEMKATARAKGDPAKIAQKNGWTFCTKKRLTISDRRDILIDVVGVSMANRGPGREISPYILEAIGEDGAARARQIAAEIVHSQ